MPEKTEGADTWRFSAPLEDNTVDVMSHSMPRSDNKNNSPESNGWALQNSQYLSKEERDPSLVYSPSLCCWLIPHDHQELCEKYRERFPIAPVFDSVLNEPTQVQQLLHVQSILTQKKADLDRERCKRALELGLNFKNLVKESSLIEDYFLHKLFGEYDHVCAELDQLSRDIEHARKAKNLSFEDDWPDPLPLEEELLPVSPFIKEMLPEALRNWVIDSSERMQVPPDFLAATCIVVLGALIGRKVGIHPKAHDNWLVIPNLWGAAIGRPSQLKSPAIAEVMKPLDELASIAIRRHQKEEESFKQKEMWQSAKESALKDKMKKAAKNIQNDMDMPQFDQVEPLFKPVLKRYKTEDGTVEKIGEILRENPQGILIHRDELMGLLKSLDKYGREGDRAFYLESWNGTGSYTVDRIGRGTLHIPALCLSIIGGIQPGPLRTYVHQALAGQSGDDGFIQRFQLLVWPDPSTTWENIDRSPDIPAKEKAFEIFENLDAFEPFEPSSDGTFEIYTIRFDQDGQKIFNDWRQSLEAKLRTNELSPALESHLTKYRSLMPSIALIFYLVETVGAAQKPVAVDSTSALRAIQWCEYLETHARRVYASGEDVRMQSARALLKRIRQGDLPDTFSKRQIYHGKHWSHLETSEKAEGALAILEELGWVKVEKTSTKGRPSIEVTVHPELRKEFLPSE